MRVHGMGWCSMGVCSVGMHSVGAHCAGVLIMHVPGVSMQKHGCSSDVKKNDKSFMSISFYMSLNH
jgi:hypothetical protein